MLFRSQARWLGEAGLADVAAPTGSSVVSGLGRTALMLWSSFANLICPPHLPTLANCTRGSTTVYSRSDTSLTTSPIKAKRYNEPSTTG